MTMPIRRGIHGPLEDAANAILKQALSGETRRSAKSDVLTEWKAHDRRKREIFVASGVPDPSVRRGNFHRAANPSKPELNSREGHAPARTSGSVSGLADFMTDQASVTSSAAWDDYA